MTAWMHSTSDAMDARVVGDVAGICGTGDNMVRLGAGGRVLGSGGECHDPPAA